MKPSAAKGGNPHGHFEWHRRRRLIYATLAFNLVSGVSLLLAFRGAVLQFVISMLCVLRVERIPLDFLE